MLENCFKKRVSLVLILVLLFTFMPMQVFASESIEDSVDVSVLNVPEKNTETVDALDGDLSALEGDAQKADAIQTKESKPAQSTKQEANETLAKSAGAGATIINSAELNPKSPKSEDLEEYLHTIMDEIITEDMTTYEKTKICYDYVVKNMKYGSHSSRLNTPIGNVTCSTIYNKYGAVEGFGAVALTAKTGMCNAYASAFILMANEIGLDAYLVKGYTRGAGGGYVYHEWAEIKIDGTVYVFDPQLEQNLTKAGLGVDNIFCKTYDQIGGRYSKA